MATRNILDGEKMAGHLFDYLPKIIKGNEEIISKHIVDTLGFIN